MSMQWPTEVPFERMKIEHQDYNPLLRDLNVPLRDAHTALYEGGRAFDRIKTRVMDRRAHEYQRGVHLNLRAAGTPTSGEQYHAMGRSTFERRKAIARYTPIASGRLDWIRAATHQAPPRLTPDQPDEYWQRLTHDCDGDGTDLEQVTRALLRDLILHSRAWLALSFPAQSPFDPITRMDQDPRVMDARWTCAQNIDNWDLKADVQWVRTHDVDDVRDNMWAESDGLRHTWIYYTPREIVTYSARDGEKHATLASIERHDFGQVPFIQLQIDSSYWLMDKLREPILKHFNRETALTWSLNQMAFSVLTLIGQSERPQVTLDPEVEALVLDQGNAQFLAPSPAVWDALHGDLERIEKALDDVIQSAALAAVRRDTQGRQSGVAKFREFGSLAPLLNEYGVVLRNSLERAVQALLRYRGDTFSVRVEGLDKFDIQSKELQTRLTQEALALPVTPVFANWMLAQYQLFMAQDAPADVRAQILRDALAGKRQPVTQGKGITRDAKSATVLVDGAGDDAQMQSSDDTGGQD